jgi:adenylate cyclase
MILTYNALAATLFWLGDFEASGQNAMHGVRIWRSGGDQSYPEDLDTPVVGCLCYKGLSEWHLGEVSSSHAHMDEAISLAKELKDWHALAVALNFAASFYYYERKPAEVERLALEANDLSTRHNFVAWLATGGIYRGWARSVSGDTAQGIAWIEQGLRDYRATGALLGVPFRLTLKAEALHLADRTSEALEAIREAEAFSERSGERRWCAELHRLRGVFLAAMGTEETQIEASFQEAIRIAKEQKSVSLEKRAEATYAEYRRQKASGSGGRGFRLPL